MLNLYIGKNIIKLKSIDSTNNYAMSLVKKNELNEGAIIKAINQIKGRGQQGNLWESEAGKNLTFSLVLCPHFLAIEKQFLLSKIISLSILDCLKKYITNISIKWPNDIYVNDDKIAGILIENILKKDKITYSVIGIGININQTVFNKSILNPTSLKKLKDKNYNLEEVLESLLHLIEVYYNELKNYNINKINTMYLNNLYLFNKLHVFKEPNGNNLEARIIDVSDTGMLVLETLEKEIKEFGFKEIVF